MPLWPYSTLLGGGGFPKSRTWEGEKKADEIFWPYFMPWMWRWPYLHYDRNKAYLNTRKCVFYNYFNHRTSCRGPSLLKIHTLCVCVSNFFHSLRLNFSFWCLYILSQWDLHSAFEAARAWLLRLLLENNEGCFSPPRMWRKESTSRGEISSYLAGKTQKHRETENNAERNCDVFYSLCISFFSERRDISLSTYWYK